MPHHEAGDSEKDSAEEVEGMKIDQTEDIHRTTGTLRILTVHPDHTRATVVVNQGTSSETVPNSNEIQDPDPVINRTGQGILGRAVRVAGMDPTRVDRDRKRPDTELEL